MPAKLGGRDLTAVLLFVSLNFLCFYEYLQALPSGTAIRNCLLGLEETSKGHLTPLLL